MSPMVDIVPALTAARAGRPQALATLRRFLRFATVSSRDDGHLELRRCARWLAGYLRHAGFDCVDVRPTGGPPVVLARMLGPARPRVVVYGHYDVVAPGPLARWRHPPFAGLVSAGRIHGRGASDDKGPLWAHVCAVLAWRRSGRALPADVTFVLDGEEEIGSPHLAGVLRGNALPRPVDVVLVSDTRMLGPDRPVLVSSLRGSVSLTVSVRSPGGELHSGAFGGAVVNPAQVLADVVASLHDHRGRVSVPGFYNSVRAPTPELRSLLLRQGLSPAGLRAAAGGAPLASDSDWTPFERTTVRPALITTGLAAGQAGDGGRNAIPRRAVARLNLRLVPVQQPRAEAARVARHVRGRVPASLDVRVRVGAATPPTVADVDHPTTAAVAAAMRDTYGQPVTYLPSGGSIPAVSMLQDQLAAPVVLMGFSQPDDAVHGVDESFALAGLWRATEACLRVYAGLAASPTPARRRAPSAATRRSDLKE